MAITFLEKRKKERYLILIFVVMILAIFLVLFGGVIKKEKVEVPKKPGVPYPKLEINWQILESTELEELQPFQKIPHLEGKVGRENPFIPYPIKILLKKYESYSTIS